MPNLGIPTLTMKPDEEDNAQYAFDRIIDLIGAPVQKKHPKLSLYNTAADAQFVSALVTSALDDPSDKTRQQVIHVTMDNTFDDYPSTIERPDVDKIFVHAAAHRAGWLAPSRVKKPYVTYTADDAISGAKEFLSTGNPDMFIAGLGHAFSPKTFGVIIENERVFDKFKEDLKLYTTMHTKSTKVQNMFDQFDKLSLSNDTLTQALLLRKEHFDIFDADSFATIMLSFIHEQWSNKLGPIVAPLSLYDLVAPRNIVFINATSHADASFKDVDTEWLMINKSTEHPLNIVNFNTITKLNQAMTNQQRTAMIASGSGSKSPAERRAKIKFRAKRPKTVNITAQIEKILLKMGQVNRSQNIIWTKHRSPLKTSRRRPTDPNAFGLVRKQTYIPDMHVFVDTSGSISIEDQKNQLIMLIQLAKKLDIDFYFSTFSHVMSPEVLIPTRGKSPAQVWNYIMSIPKVGGGTDFRQISDYINQDSERQSRMNLVITDFGWAHYGPRFKHAKNLWYAPCSMDDWDVLIDMARGFIDSMSVVEPTARTVSRCIGIFK